MMTATLIAIIATVTSVIGWRAAPLIADAGFVGTMIDSLLGATLERCGVLGNSSVNFASTLAAGTIALLIGR